MIADVDRLLPRIGWLLCVLTLAALTGQAVLLLVSGVPPVSAEAVSQAFPLIPLAIAVGAVVGAAIVQRHPRHRVGWLLCVGHAGASIGLLAEALGVAVLRHGLGLSHALAQRGLWVGHLLGATYALALLGLLLLTVPDGRLPSRGWWPIAALLAGGLTLSAAGLVLVAPDQLNPSGSQDVGLFPTVVQVSGQLAIVCGLIGAATALVVRLRRARGVERQQLRWIGAAAGALAAALALLVGDNIARGGGVEGFLYLEVLFYLAYLAVPVATGLAILRHRLYDIDAILGRTAWLLVVAVFVTAGYVAAVVAIGTVVGSSTDAVWPSLAAYAVVALAFQPLRRWADRIADRVAYGRRAGPYESLAALSRQLGARGLSDHEVVVQVARSTAMALGARAAAVSVPAAGGHGLAACWPEAVASPPTVQTSVQHLGRTVGSIELTLRPGHRLGRQQRRLLDRFAAQAGSAFEAIALTTALRDRADALALQRTELIASRRRLVQAADRERERVAALIGSRVSVHLEPIPAALERICAGTDHGGEDTQLTLRDMQRSTGDALRALRVITAGVVPPLLVRHGLVTALREHAARSASRPRVIAGPAVATSRFDPSVEAAAYLAAVTAVEGTTQDGPTTDGAGAEVVLDLSDDQLTIRVHGPRAAEPPSDRQWVIDRVHAVGGELTERTSADGGDEVLLAISLAPGGVADPPMVEPPTPGHVDSGPVDDRRSIGYDGSDRERVGLH